MRPAEPACRPRYWTQPAVRSAARWPAHSSADPIRAALVARSAALRRATRDWASIRGVDARAFYRARLDADPKDAVALTALAEMGDPQDGELFRRMVADARSRVRAAGLRGLARVDRPAGRRAAIDVLAEGAAGRLTWAPAHVLRDGTPNEEEARVLARLARDPSRTTGQRFRLLALLRPLRWLHLAVLLEALAEPQDSHLRRRHTTELSAWIATSRRIGRAPDDHLRARIEEFLPALDPGCRQQIEFVPRTSR